MNFSSWHDFFFMGGYALYVWCAYGLTLIVLAGVVLVLLLRHSQLQHILAQRERRERRQRGKHETRST